MSVSNNQPVNAEVCNAAYVSKTADSTIIGEITLNNPDSGAQVDLQRDINALKTAKDANETAITQLNNDVDAIEADIVDINNELAGISSGGGVGSSAIYAFFDAEKSDLTDFTNISIETTEPISKVQSYSIDAYPASFPVVTLDKRRKNASFGSCSFVYTLTSGTFKAKVVDDLANVLSEIELGANEAKRVVLEWKPHNTQVSYQLITEDVASATGLKIDDVEFSDASKEIKNFSVKNSISLADNGGQTITATDNLMFNGTGLGWDAVANDYELQYDASTILIKGNIAYNSAGTDLYADLYVNGALHKAITSIQGTNGSYVQFTYISERGEFNRGDKISIRAKAGTLATGLPFSHYMTINEDSISDGTVYSEQGKGENIFLSLSGNTGQTVNANNSIPFGSSQEHWDGFTFTAPRKDIYYFHGFLTLTSPLSIAIRPVKGGTALDFVSLFLSSNYHSFSTAVDLNEGETLTFVPDQQITLNNGANLSNLKISSKAQEVDNFIIANLTTNRVLGGIEYIEKSEQWDSKPVKCLSFDTSFNIPAGSAQVLATIATGLDVISIDGIGLAGASWQKLDAPLSAGGTSYFRYENDTGAIRVKNDGANFTQQRFTVKYV